MKARGEGGLTAATVARVDSTSSATSLFSRRAIVWLLLLAVFAVEFVLFDQVGARANARVYPRWNDQIQYLTESYTAYEYLQAHGFGKGIVRALTNPSAQGTLHDFAAMFAFKLAGPSRNAALALNLLALLAWQAALFVAVARHTGARGLAFATAMLPLALRGPWQPIPGSAFDFRLDHFAMCGLGVCAALAVLTDDFRSAKNSTRFGLAVGLTLLTRFLTGTYFAGIFLALFAGSLRGPERRARLANLGRAAFAAALIAGPFLWLNRAWVYDYYWIGHYVGAESAIRNPHFGLGRSLAFVGGEFATRHVGFFFGALVVSGTVMLSLLRGAERAGRAKGIAFIGAIFLLAPAAILTLHKQKSEVVVGALAPGLVLLVAAAWARAGRRTSERAQALFAAAVATAALAFYARQQFAPPYPRSEEADVRRVNALADEVFRRGRAAGLPEFRIAVDYITDALDAQVLRVICYERHRVLLPVNMTLPTSIAEPDTATVFARLAESDFVFLTEEAPAGNFPYDRKLAELRPQLRAWCDAHLRVADQFTLFGRRMLLYQRREIPFP